MSLGSRVRSHGPEPDPAEEAPSGLLAWSSMCRVCGTGRLERVVDLGDVPLANSFRTPAAAEAKEELYPLAVTFCPVCTIVQLDQLVDPDVMFRHYVYTPGASTTWRSHCAELSAWLRNRTPAGGFVIEPASNDGTLLREIRQWAGQVLGIDPAENIASAATATGIETVAEYFGRATARELATSRGKADVVVGTNVLAHVPDIVDFIRGADEILVDDGLFVIEAPYLPDLVKSTAYDSIYHEHVSYLSVSALSRVMQMGGLTLTHVERTPVHGGSIRFVAQKAGHEPDETVDEFLDFERAAGYSDGTALRRFSENVEAVRSELRRVVLGLINQGKRIAAYGATAKGTILLNTAGLGAPELRYIVDKSDLKQGLVAPGTNIPIVGPEAIAKERVDVLLILAWNLKSEVMTQESAFARAGGRFLVPIPYPELI